MANGVIPSSIGARDDDTLEADGTIARLVSPTPDTVGFDAKEDSPAKNRDSIASRVVSCARRLVGQRDGDGECFSLVDKALRAAGAKSASDFGPVTPTTDYIWGTDVTLSDVRHGDVVQFRNYRYDREVVLEDASADSDFQERPHHTAIVAEVHGAGALTVLEQNAPVGAPVAQTRLFFASGTTSTGGTTTTVSVQGIVWFYRAQAN